MGGGGSALGSGGRGAHGLVSFWLACWADDGWRGFNYGGCGRDFGSWDGGGRGGGAVLGHHAGAVAAAFGDDGHDEAENEEQRGEDAGGAGQGIPNNRLAAAAAGAAEHAAGGRVAPLQQNKHDEGDANEGVEGEEEGHHGVVLAGWR